MLNIYFLLIEKYAFQVIPASDLFSTIFGNAENGSYV